MKPSTAIIIILLLVCAGQAYVNNHINLPKLGDCEKALTILTDKVQGKVLTAKCTNPDDEGKVLCSLLVEAFPLSDQDIPSSKDSSPSSSPSGEKLSI